MPEPIYHESQEALLCGKHALNHVLQEEKFVWNKSDKNLLVGGSDPMDTDVKINLHRFCINYEALARKRMIDLQTKETLRIIRSYLQGETKAPFRNSKNASGKPNYAKQENFEVMLKKFKDQLESYQVYKDMSDEEIIKAITPQLENELYIPEYELCSLEDIDRGNLPVESFPELMRMLFYMTKTIRMGDPDIPNVSNNSEMNLKNAILEQIKKDMPNPLCLGVVLNVNYGHWTAIVKFNSKCETQKEPMYSYSDSINCSRRSIEKCYTMDSLIEYLMETIPITGAVFIYVTEFSYKSKALLNQEGALPILAKRNLPERNRKRATTNRNAERERMASQELLKGKNAANSYFAKFFDLLPAKARNPAIVRKTRKHRK